MAKGVGLHILAKTITDRVNFSDPLDDVYHTGRISSKLLGLQHPEEVWCIQRYLSDYKVDPFDIVNDNKDRIFSKPIGLQHPKVLRWMGNLPDYNIQKDWFGDGRSHLRRDVNIRRLDIQLSHHLLHLSVGEIILNHTR